MNRTSGVVAFFVAWSLFGAAAAGEVLHVEGQILGASLPWSDRLFDEREGPLLAFPSHLGPVPYTGILTIDAQSSLASFQASIDSCIAGAEYCLTAVDLETGNTKNVFAPSLPGEEARGTITAFRVVPEPENFALALLGWVALIVAQAVSRQRLVLRFISVVSVISKQLL